MRKPGLCLKTLRQGSHSYACKLVFDKFLNKLKDVAKAKSFGTLSDEELDQPWIGADWRTMSGSHGFSVPFSRKKEGDPYPGVPYHLTLSKGADSNWAGERKDFAWKDAVHSIQALGEARCLRIFYHASYTPAAGDCVAYLPHLRVVPDRVSGVAPRSRTPEPEPAIKLTRAHHARQGGWLLGSTGRPFTTPELHASCRLGLCQISTRAEVTLSTPGCHVCRYLSLS